MTTGIKCSECLSTNAIHVYSHGSYCTDCMIIKVRFGHFLKPAENCEHLDISPGADADTCDTCGDYNYYECDECGEELGHLG